MIVNDETKTNKIKIVMAPTTTIIIIIITIITKTTINEKHF